MDYVIDRLKHATSVQIIKIMCVRVCVCGVCVRACVLHAVLMFEQCYLPALAWIH